MSPRTYIQHTIFFFCPYTSLGLYHKSLTSTLHFATPLYLILHTSRSFCHFFPVINLLSFHSFLPTHGFKSPSPSFHHFLPSSNHFLPSSYHFQGIRIISQGCCKTATRSANGPQGPQKPLSRARTQQVRTRTIHSFRPALYQWLLKCNWAPSYVL